jgi:DNA-binding CsgD family transcriptional regulator
MRTAENVDADVLAALYSSLLEETSWETFLECLSALLPGGRATLFYHNHRSATGAFVLTAGFDSSLLSAYNQHFSTRNPWMPLAVTRPIGRGVCSQQMLRQNDLQKTEFYADFLRPNELVSAVGVTICRQVNTHFMLSVLHEKCEQEKAKEVADLLGRLTPHVQRVFGYYRRRVSEDLAQSASRLLSDKFGVGILQIDPDLKIIGSNAIADRLLAFGRGIRVDRTGAFRTASETVNTALNQILSGHGPLEGQLPSSSSFKIVDDYGRRSLLLTLIPVNTSSKAAHYFAGPHALVVIDDLNSPVTIPASVLREYLGVTLAEAELVSGLAAGCSVHDLANMRSVTIGTIRSQLHSIYMKVGVGGQMELLQLAVRLPRLMS